MTTAAPSTALATIQPAFTDAERLALAGFLAGYRGLTRDAYALDLRQFTIWCRARSLPLFSVRRADIEGFARDLEARGREAATYRTGCSATEVRLPTQVHQVVSSQLSGAGSPTAGNGASPRHSRSVFSSVSTRS